MKVAVYSAKPFEIKYLEVANADKHELIYLDEALSKDTIHLADGCEAISTFTNDDASAEILYTLVKNGLKFISARATGYDNIAVSHAQSLGIKVANVREYSPFAIAEHAVALMLTLNRKLILADKKVRDNNFILNDLIGFDFNEKKVGIIGCGKIGSVLAKIMHGFGCQILIHDLKEDNGLIKDLKVRYCTLDQLVRESDVISIHVPLNTETKYLINKELIEKMKAGVMLINTGRGGVLDTSSAIDGIKSGQIGYLGLDVYEKEKGMFFFDHSKDKVQDPLFNALLELPNVLVTGHQAFLTETALQNIASATIENLNCWERGILAPNEL